MSIYVIQYCHGGVPEEPRVFTDHRRARAVWRALAKGRKWTSVSSYFLEGDDDEFRFWTRTPE
jgi:hypothetical protein